MHNSAGAGRVQPRSRAAPAMQHRQPGRASPAAPVQLQGPAGTHDNSPSKHFVCRTQSTQQNHCMLLAISVPDNPFGLVLVFFFQPSWTEQIFIFSIELQREVLHRILRYYCYSLAILTINQLFLL